VDADVDVALLLGWTSGGRPDLRRGGLARRRDDDDDDDDGGRVLVIPNLDVKIPSTQVRVQCSGLRSFTPTLGGRPTKFARNEMVWWWWLCSEFALPLPALREEGDRLHFVRLWRG